MTTLFALRDGMSLTDARAILTQLPEQLADAWDLFESLVETIEVLSDEELMKQIRDLGKTVPWEEAKAKLDL